MDSQENKQLAMRGYDMFRNGDIQGILDMCADDVEWSSNESEFVPFSGTFRGKNGVAEFFTKLGQSVEAQHFEPQTFIAEGDKVSVAGTSRWRVRATGATYENRWVHIFTLKDGKTTRFEQYDNSAAVIAAFVQRPTMQPAAESPLHH